MSIDFSSVLLVFVSIDVSRSLKFSLFLYVDLSRGLSHYVFFLCLSIFEGGLKHLKGVWCVLVFLYVHF
jgi:hypothetical protein